MARVYIQFETNVDGIFKQIVRSECCFEFASGSVIVAVSDFRANLAFNPRLSTCGGEKITGRMSRFGLKNKRIHIILRLSRSSIIFCELWKTPHDDSIIVQIFIEFPFGRILSLKLIVKNRENCGTGFFSYK